MEQNASYQGQQDDWLRGAVVEARTTIDDGIDVRLDRIEFGTDDDNVA